MSRWLLCTYPRAYRRGRGEEMLGLLAESGRPPTARERVNLLRHGLRARLGRPTSRSVVVWSVLFAVLVGAVGAIGSDRLAWQAAGPLPDNATALATVRQATGEPADPDGILGRDDFVFGLSGVKSFWTNVWALAAPLGGDEYGPGEVDYSGDRPATGDHHDYLRAARQRLAGAGWQVTPVRFRDDSTCIGPPCQQSEVGTTGEFTARRGGTALDIEVDRGDEEAVPGMQGPGWDPSPRGRYVRTMATFYRATPAGVGVAMVAGGLLAELLGWLLFGWLNRRLSGPPAELWTLYQAVMGGVFLLLTAPAGIGMLALATDPDDGLVPADHMLKAAAYLGTWPEWLSAVILLILAGIAAAPMRRPAPVTRPDPGGDPGS